MFRDAAVAQMLTVAPFFVRQGIEWREDAIEAGTVHDPQVEEDLTLLYYLQCVAGAVAGAARTCSSFFLLLAAQSGGKRRQSGGVQPGA